MSRLIDLLRKDGLTLSHPQRLGYSTNPTIGHRDFNGASATA